MFSFLNRVYPNFRKIANAVASNPNRPNAIKPIGDKFNNMPKATGANGKYNLNDARQKYQMQYDAINKGQVKLPNYINVGDTSKMSPRMQQFLAEQQKRIAIDKLNESTYKNELKNIRPEDLWRNPDGSYSYNSPITGKEHKITKEDAKALNWDANQVAQIRDPLHRNRKHYGEGVFDDDAYNAYLKNKQKNNATQNQPVQQTNASATTNSQVNQQPAVNKYQEYPKYPKYDDYQRTKDQIAQRESKFIRAYLKRELAKIESLIDDSNPTQAQVLEYSKKRKELIIRAREMLQKRIDDAMNHIGRGL